MPYHGHEPECTCDEEREREEAKRKVRLTLAFGEDDWQGLYVNGKLIDQGHRISFHTLAQALGVKLETIAVDGEWLVKQGGLPQNLNDVKRKEKKR